MSGSRSEAARAASRANGRKSRGPLSYVRRQISARNAFKHGLRGRQSVEPAFLPPWLKRFDQQVVKLFGYFSQRRRELLDRALLNMLLVKQADRLIAAELDSLGWLLSDEPAASRQAALSAHLASLERLLTYRRRFSATRDRAISRIVLDKWLDGLHARIRDRHKKLRQMAAKRKRKTAVRTAAELDDIQA